MRFPHTLAPIIGTIRRQMYAVYANLIGTLRSACPATTDQHQKPVLSIRMSNGPSGINTLVVGVTTSSAGAWYVPRQSRVELPTGLSRASGFSVA
ncbi:hypothetical protein [Photorhabdus bodei]|uniref:Uncharacterized protein n=1 Tax=Photorhabdus bodei TaxID=2029681 RepID=A0AAW6BJH4_9GAMM|nr:hypothetical protein [Photorhabdus bodei]MDB6373784.1 hypothetical protein [Photorhabdus bodei]